ncbi:MAG: sulfatase-like hydrolase/transferase [Gammaproteobacteria bacterium]
MTEPHADVAIGATDAQPSPPAAWRWPEGSLTRREVLLAGVASVVAACSDSAPVPDTATPKKRPNILCFLAEDLGAGHLSVYGGEAAVTPTVERLASEGVLWRNCFSNAPVCAPSRFSMITGLPAESCGPAHHMRAFGELPFLDVAGWPKLLREAGYYCINNVKEDYNAAGLDVAATWDASSPTAHWRNRPDGAPFFAVFAPQITHEMSVFEANPALSVADGVAYTPYEPALQPVNAYISAPIIGGPTTSDQVRIPPYSPDTATTRADMTKYMNKIHLMDAELAARLAELDEEGVADDTIVLFYSDHGGVLLRSKRFCYDSGLHIPLIARFGRNVAQLAPAPPGATLDEPVTLRTALPVTILGLAALDTPDWMPGAAFAGPRRAAERYAFSMRNRMDERYDMVRTVRDARYRYIRNYMPHLPHGQHIQFMWLQAGYREWDLLNRLGALDEAQSRFWRERPAEELYDLDADPDEMQNLVGDPRHAQTLQRLSDALDAHMLAVHDNGFVPEGAATQGYLASREPGAYPLATVMQLAARAIRRDTANIPVLLDQLQADNEILRYWAALGLCMLDVQAASAQGELQSAFDRESAAHVRVALAEALARLGASGAVQFLGETMVLHDSAPVRLLAANALENIGDRALPAVPYLIAAQAALDPASTLDQYVAQAARHTALELAGLGAGVP